MKPITVCITPASFVNLYMQISKQPPLTPIRQSEAELEFKVGTTATIVLNSDGTWNASTTVTDLLSHNER